MDTFAKACDRLQKALKYADKVLSTTFPLGGVAAIVVGIVLVGAVVAGAVILTNSVTISIENRSSDTIELGGTLGFLPGVEFPERILVDRKETIRVPKSFVGRFEVRAGEIIIEVFGSTFPIPVNNLDLQRSTWDGTALAKLEGKQISVGEGNTHSLVIFSKRRQ